ncbi:hypothetical protein AB0B12_19775 [Streptomyces sp. NPDC044780]|uniref:hypothetical protein n=1 Tax=unclassified Streptomyces TaxID=2593676 RepID=UPI0033D7F433
MPVTTGMGRVAGLAVGVTLTVGAALAVGGCASDTEDLGDSARRPSASASKAAGPSRALVTWAGRMCAATKLYETVKADSADEIEEITDPPEDALIGPEFTAMGYLSSTSSSLDEVAEKLGGVPSSGIAAADRLHDSLAEQVATIRPKVTALTDNSGFTSPAEDSVDRAERVGKLIESLKRPEPGLSTVVAKEPKLLAAYRAAPPCAPPEPLPKAADGTDTGACADGRCEILVTKQVDFTLRAWRVRVSLTETKAKVSNGGPEGGAGQLTLTSGGTGSFGDAGGDTVTVRAVAVTGDGAVLRFSTK